MRWRRGPRAALAIGLAGLLALFVAAGVLRARHTSEEASARSGAAVRTIDTILTVDESGCAGVRSTEWHPLSGVEYTGRLRIRLPAQPGGALVLFIGDDLPLDIEVERADGVVHQSRQERLESAMTPGVPPDFWLEDGTPWDAPRAITRLDIDAAFDRDLDVRVLLGRRAPRVLARLVGYGRHVRVAVCAAPLGEGERYFATGWFGQERLDGTPVRWMRARGAVLVSSARHGPAVVRVRAAPAVAACGETVGLTLRVNDVFETPPVPMRAGLTEYEWAIPARAWVAGVNELLFSVSRVERRGGRELGLALASLHAQ